MAALSLALVLEPCSEGDSPMRFLPFVSRWFLSVMVAGVLSSCDTPMPEGTASASAHAGGDSFTHRPSGLVFPKNVIGFVRDTIDTEGAGKPMFNASYRATRNVGGGRMSLFVNVRMRAAPAAGATPELVRLKNREAFKKMHPKATHEVLTGANGPYDYFTFERSAWNDIAGVETHVIRHGDYLVLCTFNYLAIRHDDWRVSIDKFLASFAAQ